MGKCSAVVVLLFTVSAQGAPCDAERTACEAAKRRYAETNYRDNPVEYEAKQKACEAVEKCEQAVREQKYREENEAYERKRREEDERRRAAAAAAREAEQRVEEERLRAEQQAADAEQKAEDARRNALLTNPKTARIIFGASLCYDRALRTSALAEIAKEKKYARIGGYENKNKIYALQQQIRWADEQEARDRKDLATYRGLKPAPCSNSRVRQVIQCADPNEEACADDEAHMMSTFVANPDNE